MPVWGWVLIAIGAALLVFVIASQAMSQRRSRRLRSSFGPEYDRTLQGRKRREAEGELEARQERRGQLTIRPLSPESRQRFVTEWHEVQAQFVDDPSGAVVSGDSLIQAVMRERGYPVEEFEQRAADVSVDHPDVVENYREGHRLARASASGRGSTESLRQAMRHYRSLFDELVEPVADEPMARDTGAGKPAPTGERSVPR
jgi:hypothetical protein